MCKFKSALWTKSGKLLWSLDTDSHEDLIKENNLKDEGDNNEYVRVEYVPVNFDDFLVQRDKYNSWYLIVDQDTTPEWFDLDNEHSFIIKAFTDIIPYILKERFINIGREFIKFGKNYYLYGDINIKGICNSVEIKLITGNVNIFSICDNVKISEINGNCNIKYIENDVKIHYIGGLSNIFHIEDNVFIEYISDRCNINTITGWVKICRVMNKVTINSIANHVYIETIDDDVNIKNIIDYVNIKYIYGNCVIENIKDHVIINNVGGVSTIQLIKDFVIIKHLSDYCTINYVSDNVIISRMVSGNVKNICDNAIIIYDNDLLTSNENYKLKILNNIEVK